MKTDKERKTKREGTLNGFLLTAEALLAIVMLILIWKIASHLIDEWKSKVFFKDLQNIVVIMDEEERKDDKTVPEQDRESEISEEVKIPAAIDFDSLYEISRDAVAWIYAPDTEINYVIAQAEDNDYYLQRLLDGTSANGGTLFADCRNSSDFTDWNTVIYGHNMKNGTMFAALMNYRNPAYFEDHSVMYLYTPGHRYGLELIAGYTTNINDLIYTIPATKEERNEIIDRACRRSSFISGITVGEEDKLVTLSTCSYAYDDARYVVIGRIVNLE